MGRNKTQLEWDADVQDLVQDEYTFLEPYQGSTVKISVRHNTCGYTYSIAPKFFLKGNRCKRCVTRENAKKYTKTHKQFLQDVYTQVGNEYTVLSKYKNSSTRISVRHNICGSEYKVRPDAFLRGTRCKTCLHEEYKEKYKKTTGVQHFKPVDVFGGTEYFRVQQRHDEMKRDYAKENGFMLIEIPYTADTYDKVKDFLSKETKFIA